jgi:hypothetical protein
MQTPQIKVTISNILLQLQQAKFDVKGKAERWQLEYTSQKRYSEQKRQYFACRSELFEYPGNTGSNYIMQILSLWNISTDMRKLRWTPRNACTESRSDVNNESLPYSDAITLDLWTVKLEKKLYIPYYNF